MRSWLKRDALNRAWRVLLQTVGAVIIVPAVMAAGYVLQTALTDGAGDQGYDWTAVGHDMLRAAVTGAVISVLAYLHRLKLDPSRIPSALPPAPTPTPPTMAQR